MRIWLFFGGLNGLIGIMAGAYGWHWLDGAEGHREIFRMGVDYQVRHALALLVVAWLASRCQGSTLKIVHGAGTAFTAGILFFSGSLYAFGVSGILPLSGLAPLGGFLLMAGWAAIIAAALVKER